MNEIFRKTESRGFDGLHLVKLSLVDIKLKLRYVDDTLVLAKEEGIMLSLISSIHFIKILNLR